MKLSTRIHDRDAAGLRYVYPVVSRRAGGLSVGINLNPNNACNWRCLYCQVPGLVAGKGPPIDLDVLRDELGRMLDAILHGDYMQRSVPEGFRKLNDIAFSGNGEPTGSPHFREAVRTAVEVLRASGAPEQTRSIVITNGSLVHQASVQEGLSELATRRGEAWFKVDSATDVGMLRLNSVHTGAERAARNLQTSAGLIPTWIQTMMLALDGALASEAERHAYLQLIERAVREDWGVRGVLLYGLARASYQPEAGRLSAVTQVQLEDFAEAIRQRGMPVRVHA